MVFDSLMILLPDYDCGVLFAAPSLPGVFEVFLRTEEYLTEAQYLTFILIRNCTSQRLTIPTPLLVQVERVLDGVSSKFFDGAQSGYDALSNSPPFYFLVWSVVKLAQAGIFYDIVPICKFFYKLNSSAYYLILYFYLIVFTVFISRQDTFQFYKSIKQVLQILLFKLVILSNILKLSYQALKIL
eukprot:EST42297.1 Transmembrane domain-containing protein [Spironucleus salmonicida]